MPNHSLLFVPDITGFTEFVNNTEIDHSQHIISELLEKIIDANELDLEVSEVEGDAVLFYKQNHVPSIEEIYEQAKKIFLAFHAHLKLYETQRICQCGACSTATNLTLKFIVHSAEIGFTNIKKQMKPFGADVVLLHRLFKNDVDLSEYILFSEKFLNHMEAEGKTLPDWEFQNGVSDYPNIGLVKYKYLPLKKLLSEIPEPPPVVRQAKMKNPLVKEQVFDLPIMDAYAYLSDFELKKTWNDDIKEFRYEKGKVTRVGTKHVCVFDSGTANIESVTNDFGEGKLVYGERILKFPLARDFTIYFILTPQGEKSLIRIEAHYQPLPIIGWILQPIIGMNIKKVYQKLTISFSKLKPLGDVVKPTAMV